jgi:hypothetical protein
MLRLYDASTATSYLFHILKAVLQTISTLFSIITHTLDLSYKHLARRDGSAHFGLGANPHAQEREKEFEGTAAKYSIFHNVNCVRGVDFVRR